VGRVALSRAVSKGWGAKTLLFEVLVISLSHFF